MRPHNTVHQSIVSLYWWWAGEKTEDQNCFGLVGCILGSSSSKFAGRARIENKGPGKSEKKSINHVFNCHADRFSTVRWSLLDLWLLCCYLSLSVRCFLRCVTKEATQPYAPPLCLKSGLIPAIAWQLLSCRFKLAQSRITASFKRKKEKVWIASKQFKLFVTLNKGFGLVCGFQ